MLRNLSVILLLLVLTACASGIQNDAQRVFQIQQNYNTGLAVAAAYKALPECPTTLVCKKPEIVKALQDADSIAAPGLKSAQACVRSPVCTNTALAVDAANTAVAALTAITSKLNTKEKK